jgi:adenylate kinase family enzyme
MNLIMLAPPGAGKGTHCGWLTHETGVAHISSGDLLRAEIGTGTDLGRRLAEYTGRGDLVSDDLVFALLIPVVAAAARERGLPAGRIPQDARAGSSAGRDRHRAGSRHRRGVTGMRPY